MITVYIKRIESIPENEKQNIINSLSSSAKERLNKKRNEDLYLASICALSLLNNKQRESLEYNQNGRPFFSNLDADISISHSKTHVAVAISTNANEKVGIDIENEEKNNPSTRFFTENEKKAMQINQKFIEIWTKKEALFKFLKDDSSSFISLDSTTPEKYGAAFTADQIDKSILTVCSAPGTQIEIIKK